MPTWKKSGWILQGRFYRVDFTGYPSNHFSGCRLNGRLSLILCKTTQVLITIGFEPQGLPCKMWESVRLKWGHTNKAPSFTVYMETMSHIQIALKIHRICPYTKGGVGVEEWKLNFLYKCRCSLPKHMNLSIIWKDLYSPSYLCYSKTCFSLSYIRIRLELYYSKTFRFLSTYQQSNLCYRKIFVTRILYYWEIFYYSAVTIQRFHCICNMLVQFTYYWMTWPLIDIEAKSMYR